MPAAQRWLEVEGRSWTRNDLALKPILDVNEHNPVTLQPGTSTLAIREGRGSRERREVLTDRKKGSKA
jgi:hypothetical protein